VVRTAAFTVVVGENMSTTSTHEGQ